MTAPAHAAHGTAGFVAAPPAQLIQRIRHRLANEGLPPDPDNIAKALRAERIVDEVQMLGLLRAVHEEIAGAGPLTAVLADPSTTDVVVNGPEDVRVDRGRGWEAAGIVFPDAESVTRLARRLAAAAGVRLDDAHPYADGRLPDGTRLHAVLAPLAAAGTCISLRVLRPATHTLDSLAASGMFPGVGAAAVHAIVDARLAFLISGGTGTGKTTLLGAMVGIVSPAERVLLVEDAEELLPRHPHLLRLVARGANVEGVGAIGMADLVRQALRMRPDRLLVGEVRGVEVIDMLGALSTGHEGGGGTVHANSAASVPSRIVALARSGGVDAMTVHTQLGQAVQVVLHLRRRRGHRTLAEIAVLHPREDGTVRAVPAIVEGAPTGEGAAILAQALAAREVTTPW